MESVYCAVRTDSLYKADYVSSLKGYQSSYVSYYSINFLGPWFEYWPPYNSMWLRFQCLRDFAPIYRRFLSYILRTAVESGGMLVNDGWKVWNSGLISFKIYSENTDDNYELKTFKYEAQTALFKDSVVPRSKHFSTRL